MRSALLIVCCLVALACLVHSTVASSSMPGAKRVALLAASKHSALCHHLVRRYGQVYFQQKPVCKFAHQYEKVRHAELSYHVLKD